MEPHESLLDAANRELTEELGVAVREVGKPILSIEDRGSPFVIEFVPTLIIGEPTCLEQSELRWAQLRELRELPLAPSDREFVEYLLARAGHTDRHPEGQPAP